MTYDLQLETRSPGRRAPTFVDYQPSKDDFRAAVTEGLSRPEKALPCRFLYDARGSALFDKICQLPEYYPTRTEMRILKDAADEIAGHVGPDAQLVELGSGASAKVRIILDALETPASYVPIDISAEHLLSAARRIQADYPDLQVQAICADYGQAFELPASDLGRRVGFYPGSTIGNHTPDEARAFLKLWARRLGPGAAFLIGVDLRKSAAILEPAYDDAAGVTAAFSLNLLARANRELGANFDLDAFVHEARYLQDEGRIAIHLRALTSQSVLIGGRQFQFAKGERLHIEDSWKYSLDGFRTLAREAGFAAADFWVDDNDLFSVHLLDVPS